jgi:general L-amino acid transport system substrate-binding protein
MQEPVARNTRMRRRGLLATGAATGLASLARAARAQPAVNSPTLETVRKRGQLIAGVDTGIPGYAFQDSAGNWKGLDVSYCRAIAVAVLGDPEKVKYIGCTSQVRFSVLQSGEIDVLIRDSEHTLLRNSKLQFELPAVNFYTGQSFMVNKSLKVAHVKELNGATIGLLTGTTLETNIANYNGANNIKINTLLFDRPEEIYAAMQAGRCDGYTDDGGSVAAARSAMKTPGDWVILPETISRQPLGSFTRFGDDPWTSIVRWTHYAMLEAEVLGITKANIDQVKAKTTDPQTKQFLGMEGSLGKGLGLDDAFAYNIIKSEGNYGEVYETYFGSKGLGLARGLNNLYLNGGLQYPLSWY